MSIKQLQNDLQEGRPIVLPTETVYGLFAIAKDQSAVDAVYQLKKRPRTKALNLNVSSLDMIKKYAKNPPDYLDILVENFMPGPLTIILQANEEVPSWVNLGLKTVGFRMPDHPVTMALIKEYGPLIGPSANLSGRKSGTVFSEVMSEFNQKINGYADDKALSQIDSTILDLSGKQALIRRKGSITKKELLRAVPQLTISLKD